MAVAVQVEAPRIIKRYTCDSSTGIAKGTLLQLTDENTASASSGDNQPFAGIAVEEKVATETDIITIGAAMDGDWDIDTTAAAVTAGQMVNLTAANAVAASVDADFEQGSIVGKAMETRDTDNRIRVRLMGF